MMPSEYLQKGWTRKFSAVTSCSAATRPTSSNATNWCMEGARAAAFTSNHINREIQCQLRNTILELIEGKIYNNKNIIQRFLINRKYRKTTDLNTIAFWNDYYCKDQQEAIELMQEAERIIGLTPEKMIPSQTTKINDIVNGQLEEILNNIPVAYVEKETVSV